ncbi:hypothetical protein NDU88_003439 [Pleurodeles waltl]|uniref:Uncharacterized protein n=1 Tax=Pleurodeles waltl TaxID=8319 RepID=A0AAV7W4Q8_PLEWA|nr:hypothetical protein NDU88_003439 [Pleurodeles waltl]
MRRSGASLWQRVGGRGRGVELVTVVPCVHRLSDYSSDEHAQKGAGITKETAEQAQLPLKKNSERMSDELEERTLEVSKKMAAPRVMEQKMINLVSDEEEELQNDLPGQ